MQIRNYDPNNNIRESREERERMEVAEAAMESNPNDFSEEHEISRQALGGLSS